MQYLVGSTKQKGKYISFPLNLSQKLDYTLKLYERLFNPLISLIFSSSH